MRRWLIIKSIETGSLALCISLFGVGWVIPWEYFSKIAQQFQGKESQSSSENGSTNFVLDGLEKVEVMNLQKFEAFDFGC